MIEPRTMFVLATAVIAVAAAAIAIVVLRRMLIRTHVASGSQFGANASLQWGQLLVAAASGGAVVLAAAIASLLLGLGGFGLIHIAYMAVAVVPPLFGAAVLCTARNGNPIRVPISMWMLAGLMLLTPAVCAYASFLEPYQLVVEYTEVPIAGLTSDDQPIRIAVLADIQTDAVGRHEHRAIELALAAQPDLIVLPGDIFQGREPDFRRELPAMHALLARLHAPFGVFACIGNVDNPDRTPELLAGTDVRMLFNEVTVVEVRGRKVAIGGIDWKCYSRRAQETMRGMALVEADVRILLSHCPDGALVAQSGDRIDLIIAGHTHGGQVVIPGFGPLMTASDVPRSVAAGGLHRLNGHLLYVSRGVGFERGWAPPIRLFCRPEVSVLTLRSDTAR